MTAGNDGLVLVCFVCRWRMPEDMTVGLAVGAHFETEHPGVEPRLELVPICRCDIEMVFERTEGIRDHFACTNCHRTRVIRRQEA